MIATGQPAACFVFAADVCVIWDATVQFWELVITIGFTALVTWATIYWSVRASRDATTKQLDAARTAALAEGERVAKASRARMAEAMIRTVYHLTSTLNEAADAPGRTAAEAEWAAIKIQFETAGETRGSEMFDYADGLVRRAQATPSVWKTAHGGNPTLTEEINRRHIKDKTEKQLAGWVSDPVSIPSEAEVEDMRGWRSRLLKVRAEELLARVNAIEAEMGDAAKDTD